MSKPSAIAATLTGALREMRVCRECAKPFHPKRLDQVFCRPPCRAAWWKRAQDRGAQLYHVAMEWRAARGKGKTKISDLTDLLDRWYATDGEQRKAVRSAEAALKAAKKEGVT